MSRSPEHELIERAQQGDPEAVASLYRQHVGAIARYIGYRVPDNAVIEDLTAEVFLRMVEGLPHYQFTGAPFEAWLYRIAAARIADYYRQRADQSYEALADALRDGTTGLELSLEQREEIDALRAALGQLTPAEQTLLILRFVERKSHNEVAQILNKSAEAIATAQHRALKRLAEILGAQKTGRHYLRGRSA